MPGGAAESGFVVADETRVAAGIRRLAASIHAGGDRLTGLIGIRRRGVPLARELARELAALTGTALPVGEIGVKRYADDLSILHERPMLDILPLPFAPRGARIVLVDDVLYSGHTLFAAMQHLAGEGVEAMRCAVLCARGRPNFAVAADYVAFRFDVAPDVRIEVELPPFETTTAITLKRNVG